MAKLEPPPELERPSPICQYCLADSRYTELAVHLPAEKRCPVCGSSYSGPRRDLEFVTLLEHGFVKVA